MSARDYIIGNRRGYVMERAGRPPRIVVEIGGADHVMDIANAKSLFTLLAQLLREAGALGPVWIHILGHNLTIAGALCQAFADGLDEAEEHSLYHKFGYRAAECWSPNAAGRPALSVKRGEP